MLMRWSQTCGLAIRGMTSLKSPCHQPRTILCSGAGSLEEMWSAIWFLRDHRSGPIAAANCGGGFLTATAEKRSQRLILIIKTRSGIPGTNMIQPKN